MTINHAIERNSSEQYSAYSREHLIDMLRLIFPRPSVKETDATKLPDAEKKADADWSALLQAKAKEVLETVIMKDSVSTCECLRFCRLWCLRVRNIISFEFVFPVSFFLFTPPPLPPSGKVLIPMPYTLPPPTTS